MFSLTAIKVFFTSFMSFLLKWWKPILCIALLYGSYYIGHKNGFKEADDSWVKKYNTDTGTLNSKISSIEKTSREEVTALTTDMDRLREKLAQALAKSPELVFVDRVGKQIACNGKPITEIYLGEEFTKEWNELNSIGSSR